MNICSVSIKRLARFRPVATYEFLKAAFALLISFYMNNKNCFVLLLFFVKNQLRHPEIQNSLRQQVLPSLCNQKWLSDGMQTVTTENRFCS